VRPIQEAAYFASTRKTVTHDKNWSFLKDPHAKVVTVIEHSVHTLTILWNMVNACVAPKHNMQFNKQMKYNMTSCHAMDAADVVTS